jgi:hypothetical protein
MARVQALLATADDNLSEAVAALGEAEDGPGSADGDLVNRLDAEVSRLKDEYREADDELGRVHAHWYEEEADGDDASDDLDVDEAAEIWLSRGMDEGDTFGYSEDELRRALGRS